MHTTNSVFQLAVCRRKLIVCFLSCLALIGCFDGRVNEAPADRQKPPNVLLIIADDLGYADIGAFGSEIETPNLDSLALEGVRYSRFYATPACSPTRAQLMSGADNHLAGIGAMIIRPYQKGKPGYEGHLNDHVHILPKLLADAGYRTYMTGKWHLGVGDEYSARARGFQRSFTLLGGIANHYNAHGGSCFSPISLYREDGEFTQWPKGRYSSDLYTDKIIEYLKGEQGSNKPFFAYVAYTAPHFPLQAPMAYRGKYKGVYDDGYEAVALERMARMVKMGLVKEPMRRSTDHLDDAWQSLDADEKRYEARRMELHAAMIDGMDQNIGRLFQYLDAAGELQNTIVIFLSDNGVAATEARANPNVKHQYDAADNSLENLGAESSYISLGPAWAEAISLPFRGAKHETYEGGLRVPAFVWWGGEVQALKNTRGAIDHRTLNVRDLSASILTQAGYEIEAVNASAPDKHVISGRPIVFTDSQTNEPSAHKIGWEYNDRYAYRKGDWKIVKNNVLYGSVDRVWRLYDLSDDPGETIDHSMDQPVLLEELIAEWEVYVRDNQVVLPTPDQE